MNSRVFFALAVAPKVSFATAQDTSTRTLPLDSATLDTMILGPAYIFTGREHSLLLTAVFRRISELAETPESVGVVCLGVGRRTPGDAPASVVRGLSSAALAARPRSACTSHPGFRRQNVTEIATGRPAFFLDITSLGHQHGDSVVVYSSYYVGSLWAAGFVCSAQRQRSGWVLGACHRTWVS